MGTKKDNQGVKSTQAETDKTPCETTTNRTIETLPSGLAPPPAAFHPSTVHSGSPPSPPPNRRHSSQRSRKEFKRRPVPPHHAPHGNPRVRPFDLPPCGSGSTPSARQPLRGLSSTPRLLPLRSGAAAPPPAPARSLRAFQ